MSRYLNLVRQAAEEPEKDPQPPTDSADNVRIVEQRSARPAIEVLSRVLSRSEALTLGLNPRLTWMRVACGGDVEPSEPPKDWDGVLPTACPHPSICKQLGPCPFAVARCQQKSSN